jgi:predicted ABC-type ATPase
VSAPELLIISGANGSGKTTFARECVAQFGLRYLGADDIAAELSPAHPTQARVGAGRLFAERLAAAIDKRESLIIESTLAGKSLTHALLEAKASGFYVKLFYIFVDSPELCLARISARVAGGGHDVPEQDVRRRFRRSLQNFWNLYRPLASEWTLFDNTENGFEQIASGTPNVITPVDEQQFDQYFSVLEGKPEQS